MEREKRSKIQRHEEKEEKERLKGRVRETERQERGRDSGAEKKSETEMQRDSQIESWRDRQERDGVGDEEARHCPQRRQKAPQGLEKVDGGYTDRPVSFPAQPQPRAQL